MSINLFAAFDKSKVIYIYYILTLHHLHVSFLMVDSMFWLIGVADPCPASSLAISPRGYLPSDDVIYWRDQPG